MRTRPEFDAADVRVLMAAGRAEAERRGFAVTIAIVDQAGVLLAPERLDGARLHTPEAATLKALTAAIVRTPTKSLQQAVSKDPALLAFPCRLPLTGGMPLHHGGVLVGGVGSSGGELDDVAVCRACDRGAGSEVGDTERGRCRGDVSVAATSALPTRCAGSQPNNVGRQTIASSMSLHIVRSVNAIMRIIQRVINSPLSFMIGAASGVTRRRRAMAVRIKAACVAVTLAMGLLGATTAARADLFGIYGGGSQKNASWGLEKEPTLAGAPSPEVDTLLGFLVVAGTVAFIKRRRGGKVEAQDDAA